MKKKGKREKDHYYNLSLTDDRLLFCNRHIPPYPHDDLQECDVNEDQDGVVENDENVNSCSVSLFLYSFYSHRPQYRGGDGDNERGERRDVAGM